MIRDDHRPSARTSPLVWDEADSPRSGVYDDVYFSRDDGLAESRAVFIDGCRLPRAWAGRTHFTVAELGFGTGLNIVALLDLWRHTRHPEARLSVFSVEAHPITAADAARALARWPEVADVSKDITTHWPGRARGVHRIDLPHLGAIIDVAIMDALEGLRIWSGAADAWFLDGFAPARNPDMWSLELLQAVAARSASGAHAASFTVAGQVRRDLATAGFTVERVPGFGRKRHRLEARAPGDPPADRARPRVAIVGAGIAGASLARAFKALNVSARVFDGVGPGAGASGGPAALVAPRLDAGLADNAALFAQAFRRATALYDATDGAVLALGAEQRRVGPKDAGRFSAIAGSDLFEPDAMRLTPDGLRIETAAIVEPGMVLSAWIVDIRQTHIAALAWSDGIWRLLDQHGAAIDTAEVVCLAAGMDCARLAAGVALHPVRGQASVADGAAQSQAVLFGGYLIPTRSGVVFGATHDRDDTDVRPRAADHARNLEAVAAACPELAADLASRPLSAWTGIRATTRDYLPLAGAVPGAEPGLYVLSGLGSRGFTLAPLLSEHVAASAMSLPSPLARNLADLVDPARFERRARRRRPPGTAS
jgi:tRNA 5-methylaminomethyl-2-thiouridine biosynthesis bifunctional protein